MELTAVLSPAEEGGYVALNPETGTTTQGETFEEALANLQEATALYLSEFPLLVPGFPETSGNRGATSSCAVAPRVVLFLCIAKSKWALWLVFCGKPMYRLKN